MANPFPQIDYNPVAVLDDGLGVAINIIGPDISRTAISGYGLVTFGFLWDCEEIWYDNDETLTTVWTESSGGVFGDCVY